MHLWRLDNHTLPKGQCQQLVTLPGPSTPRTTSSLASWWEAQYMQMKWTQQSSKPGGSPKTAGRLYFLGTVHRLSARTAQSRGLTAAAAQTLTELELWMQLLVTVHRHEDLWHTENGSSPCKTVESSSRCMKAR